MRVVEKEGAVDWVDTTRLAVSCLVDQSRTEGPWDGIRRRTQYSNRAETRGAFLFSDLFLFLAGGCCGCGGRKGSKANPIATRRPNSCYMACFFCFFPSLGLFGSRPSPSNGQGRVRGPVPSPSSHFLSMSVPHHNHSRALHCSSPLAFRSFLHSRTHTRTTVFTVPSCPPPPPRTTPQNPHVPLQTPLSCSASRSCRPSTSAVRLPSPSPLRLRAVTARSASFQPPIPTSETMRTEPGICG